VHLPLYYTLHTNGTSITDLVVLIVVSRGWVDELQVPSDLAHANPRLEPALKELGPGHTEPTPVGKYSGRAGFDVMSRICFLLGVLTGTRACLLLRTERQHGMFSL
jgi:hypothetical protein